MPPWVKSKFPAARCKRRFQPSTCKAHSFHFPVAVCHLQAPRTAIAAWPAAPHQVAVAHLDLVICKPHCKVCTTTQGCWWGVGRGHFAVIWGHGTRRPHEFDFPPGVLENSNGNLPACNTCRGAPAYGQCRAKQFWAAPAKTMVYFELYSSHFLRWVSACKISSLP